MNSIKILPENIKLKKLKRLKNPLINLRKIADPLTNFNSFKGNKEISYDNCLKFKRFSISNNSNDSSINQTVKLISNKLNDISTNKLKNNSNKDLSGISMLNNSNSAIGERNFYIKNRLNSFKIRMVGSFKNKIDNLTQQNLLSPILKNGFDLNNKEKNKAKLANLNKIWDEFSINDQYRKFFKYIYKELDKDYKQELYQKEIDELNNVKACIKELKYFINLREEDLMDIKIFVDLDGDIRLSRRIYRDIIDRGREMKTVIDRYHKFVKPAFEKYIGPTRKHADIIIPRGAANSLALDLITSMLMKVLGENES